MANFKKRQVDFEEIEFNPEAKVVDIVPVESMQIIARRHDGTVQILTRTDAKEYKASEFTNYNTNQIPIEDGGVQAKYLAQDLELAEKYFFNELDSSVEPEINVRGNYLDITAFPLPDVGVDKDGKQWAYTPDYEDMRIVMPEYPEYGPWGLYIKTNSSNLGVIRKVLDGHLFDTAIGDQHFSNPEDLTRLGWTWVCFHKEESRWNFNRNDIKKGDSLTKFLMNLFDFLSGVRKG